MTLADSIDRAELEALTELTKTPTTVALDLFAGHGWGVACRRLGIEEHAVELMPEAIATREANGLSTPIFRDVWDGLIPGPDGLVAPVPRYELLIASPPCQTFSPAGNGAGRRALSEVLLAIAERDYLDPVALKAFGDRHDPRTALVLSPLAYIARDLPRIVVLEQVPQVLPVWEAYADEMRRWGYSVVTAVLNAEQYGVPQTRKRAILVARWDAEAKMPTPTHSLYHTRSPKKLDADVLPWVSMAEALGWGRSARPSVTVTGGGTDTGGAEPLGHLSREMAADDWVMRSNYGTSGDPANRGEREASQPAATVTSKAGRNHWVQERHRGAGMLERHGQRPARPVEHPAPTVTGNASGTTPGGFRVRPADERETWRHGETGEPIKLDPSRPATTVAGDPRLSSRDHHNHGEQAGNSTRVTVEEAAKLQTYPHGFRWDVDYLDPRDGKVKPVSKGKKYLQVGNAVPCLLAEVVLREALR